MLSILCSEVCCFTDLDYRLYICSGVKYFLCSCPVIDFWSLSSVQRAGPSQAAGGGGGHRGLAEESRLLGPGASGRSGPLLHQRGRRQRLRPARGAQLPRPEGELSPFATPSNHR